MIHCLDWMCYKTENQSNSHIIEEAGFLSLLLSNHGSYRAKSLWWRADVELGVGGEKGNLWERCVSLVRGGGGEDVQVFWMQFILTSCKTLCVLFFLFSCWEEDLQCHWRWHPPPRTQSADFVWKMCSRTCRSIISFPSNPHHSEMILIYTGIWIKIGGEPPKSFPSKSFRSDENMHWISQLEQKELWKYYWWEIDIRQL